MNKLNDLGPIAQFQLALLSPIALIIGGLAGGLMPITSYVTAHYGKLVQFQDGHLEFGNLDNLCWILVFGPLAFSSKTIYEWGSKTFDSKVKAGGFVATLEMALLLSPHPYLAYAALAFLVLINAVATGAKIAISHLEDKPAIHVLKGKLEQIGAPMEAENHNAKSKRKRTPKQPLKAVG